MKHLLEDATILITGASAGFGAEYARQTARCAKRLILVARRKDRLEALKEELEGSHPSLVVDCLQADLNQAEDTAQLLGQLQDQEIDVLINNAGLGDHGPFESSDWTKIESMLAVNISALTRLTHAILPGMLRRNHGGILNVSSVAALVPVPGMSVYAATKAYVSSLTEGIRAEVSGSRVHVCAVCPGPVDTEFTTVARRPGEEGHQTPDAIKVPASRVVAESLAALDNNRARVIPGFIIALLLTITACIPFFLLRPILACGARRDGS